MDNAIELTVIMPAYNTERYIAQAVESVRAQTWGGSWELLVIDDCSQDGTGRAVAPYLSDSRIQYIRQEKNCGVAAARNCGIANARGRYVAFLDSDDWWAPDKLRLQMECIARTGAALCCTGRELMRGDGSPAGRVIPVPERIDYKMLLRTNVIPCGSVVLRTDLAQKYGFVHDEFHEDYILWVKVLQDCGEAAGVNVPALKCRLSGGGKSRNKFRSARMQYGSYRCLGFGRFRSLYYMLYYTVNGFLKYMG